MEVRASSQGWWHPHLSQKEGAESWVQRAVKKGPIWRSWLCLAHTCDLFGRDYIQGVVAGGSGEKEFECLWVGALLFQFITDPTSSYLWSCPSSQECAFLTGGYF